MEVCTLLTALFLVPLFLLKVLAFFFFLDLVELFEAKEHLMQYSDF